MHGAFIVHPKEETLKHKYPYTRDYTLMLEAWDVDLAREEIGVLLEGMKQVNALMTQGKLDPVTHGFFRSYAEFVKAYASGKYIPPYLQSRSGGSEFRYNFFGINGKSYPALKHMGIKQGDCVANFSLPRGTWTSRRVSRINGDAIVRTTLIEFSTMREDDLAYATHAFNASSKENFAQTHGDVASIDWFPEPNHALGVSVNSRSDDVGMGVDGLDSIGASYIYAPPDTLRYMTRVRRAGIILDRQQARVSDKKYWLNPWITGAAFNLNDDPSGNWSFDAQLIRNQGADVAADVSTHYGRARSRIDCCGNVAALHCAPRIAYALAGDADGGHQKV